MFLFFWSLKRSLMLSMACKDNCWWYLIFVIMSYEVIVMQSTLNIKYSNLRGWTVMWRNIIVTFLFDVNTIYFINVWLFFIIFSLIMNRFLIQAHAIFFQQICLRPEQFSSRCSFLFEKLRHGVLSLSCLQLKTFISWWFFLSGHCWHAFS